MQNFPHSHHYNELTIVMQRFTGWSQYCVWSVYKICWTALCLVGQKILMLCDFKMWKQILILNCVTHCVIVKHFILVQTHKARNTVKTAVTIYIYILAQTGKTFSYIFRYIRYIAYAQPFVIFKLVMALFSWLFHRVSTTGGVVCIWVSCADLPPGTL